MRQQLLGGCQKSNRVRQLRMQLKRSLIHPLGMNREHQTTNLRQRRLHHPQQLLAKRHLLSRQRLKPDEKVKGQAAPPDHKYERILATLVE
jgi:hypothetical protein